MTDYALVKDGVVINTIVWDGETAVDFGDGVKAVAIPEGQSVTMGFLYKGSKFTAPELTDEQVSQNKAAAISENKRMKDNLMAAATIQIAPLQDAVDLDMATDDELKMLNAWKKYRVLLNRLDANTDAVIKWPELPAP